MGTIGGNICTASGAADLVPCLVALEADVILEGINGDRRISVQEFILANRKTMLHSSELLREVRIKKMKMGSGAAFIKMGLRSSQAISVVNSAVVLWIKDGQISKAVIVVGCAAPKAIRCPNAEKKLLNKRPSDELFKMSGNNAIMDINPMDDIRGSAEFRSHLVGVLVTKALQRAYQKCLG
jgi:carbon-monoxide dehydrogenase medium subunit